MHQPVREAEGLRLLILDTGPIREIVIHKAVFDLKFRSLSSSLTWLKTQDSYSHLSLFISRFRQKFVTCGTVVELHKFIQDTPREGRRDLWGLVCDEFRAMDVNEQIIRLLNLKIENLARLGPVDTSVLELAHVHKAVSPVVLTIDSALQRECRQAGVHAKHLDDVLS